MSEVNQNPAAILAAALAAANAAAETTSVDMSEVSKGGGGERRVLPEGFAFARLVEYVEYGEHIAEFDGKPKPPAMKFRMAFALWGDTNPGSEVPAADRPDDLFHYFHEGVAKPAILRTFDMYLGNNEKARTKLAFDKMNYDNKPFKSFGQMLGQAFLLPVTRKKIAKGVNAGKFRNDINWANIMAPRDPISRQPYPVPEMPMELLRYFFFDNPTPETWAALAIEGTNDKGESKDFIRDDIKKAVNFEGSALHIMLGGVAGAATALPVPDLTQQAAPAVPQVNVEAAGAVTPPAVPVIAPAAVATDLPFDGGTPMQAPVVVVAPAVPTLPTMPALPAL
jgi:hypothetical protein